MRFCAIGFKTSLSIEMWGSFATGIVVLNIFQIIITYLSKEIQPLHATVYEIRVLRLSSGFVNRIQTLPRRSNFCSAARKPTWRTRQSKRWSNYEGGVRTLRELGVYVNKRSDWCIILRRRSMRCKIVDRDTVSLSFSL